MYPLFHHQSEVEKETSKRIKLSVAAYAYEMCSTPVMTDEEFDNLAKSVNLSVSTSRPDLDEWWRKEFVSDTGMWIWKHPELARIGEIYANHYKPPR